MIERSVLKFGKLITIYYYKRRHASCPVTGGRTFKPS